MPGRGNDISSRRPLALTGGTGLVGRAVLRALAQDGRTVRALHRDTPGPEAVTWVTGELERPESLRHLVRGAGAVLHLAAAMGVSDPQQLQRVNVAGTRALLNAARAAGVQRFVYVSSAAAGRETRGPYADSKRAAEELVRASGLDWVVLRPPAVIGPGSQLETTVLRLARLGVVPVVGGRGPLHPVHVDDLARLCLEAADREGIGGRTYAAGGPDPVSMTGLARAVVRASPHRALVVPLPGRVALAAARVLEAVLPRPPLTREAVQGILEGGAGDSGPARQALGFEPRSLEQALGGRHETQRGS